MECELCKMRLPFQVQNNGLTIELLEYEKPEVNFYVIESVTT